MSPKNYFLLDNFNFAKQYKNIIGIFFSYGDLYLIVIITAFTLSAGV